MQDPLDALDDRRLLAVVLADLARDESRRQLGPDGVLLPVVMTGHVLPLIESPFTTMATRQDGP